MVAKTYTQVDQYLTETQAALEESEAVNSLMLGICLRLQRTPGWCGTAPYFVTVADAQGLLIAAVMTPPHNIVVYGRQSDIREAAGVVVQDLKVSGWHVPGVLGPAHVASQFASAWTEITGQKHEQGTRQRVYELTEVKHFPAIPGQLRLATEDDLELLTEWYCGFNEGVFGRSHRDRAREATQRRINEGEVFVWEDEGPVSMAARVRATKNGIAVSGVYTPPELRRRGYATACVAALSQLLLDSGYKFCTLFADLANPTSNAIYQKIGYRPVSDFTEYLFRADT